MAPDATKLLEDALRLSEQERAELAAYLIDSLDQGIDDDAQAAWHEEIARRVAELDKGSVKPIPWPQVHRRLRPRSNDSPDA